MKQTAKRSTTKIVTKLYDGKLRLERRNGAAIILRIPLIVISPSTPS